MNIAINLILTMLSSFGIMQTSGVSVPLPPSVDTSLVGQMQQIVNLLAQIVLLVTALASILVRVYPKGDSTKMAGYLAVLHKWAAYLPTFGVNPRTRQLEELVKAITADQAAKASVEPISEEKLPGDFG